MGKIVGKIQSVGRQNELFSSKFLGSTFLKEKIFFLSKQRKKTTIVLAQHVHSLCKK